MLAGMGAALGPQPQAVQPAAAKPVPLAPRTLVFPRDFGSHPDLRTEWWYITGHCTTGNAGAVRDFGFQLTFFRVRVDNTQKMASRFAARQLLFAHAAVTDVQGKHFWHAQRIARQGFDVAAASEQDTAIRLHDWSLVRQGAAYQARISATDFGLRLDFTPTQGVLLQGSNGLSRKGPEAEQASYYYSQPQLALHGEIQVQGQRFAAQGEAARTANSAFTPGRGAAWLDHEWSDALLHPDAVGWDWIGINLFDGSALTAFQMRTKAGRALWDGGSFRHPQSDGAARRYAFAPGEVIFQALRGWKSPQTQTTYPVEWVVRTPADYYVVKAVLDNQELDSRNSTGAIYWEGLCDLFNSNRQRVGRGYLEMTGYAKPLVL